MYENSKKLYGSPLCRIVALVCGNPSSLAHVKHECVGVLCRFDAQTGADREVQRILLELLNQMDGFDQTVNVKVS